MRPRPQRRTRPAQSTQLRALPHLSRAGSPVMTSKRGTGAPNAPPTTHKHGAQTSGRMRKWGLGPARRHHAGGAFGTRAGGRADEKERERERDGESEREEDGEKDSLRERERGREREQERCQWHRAAAIVIPLIGSQTRFWRQLVRQQMPLATVVICNLPASLHGPSGTAQDRTPVRSLPGAPPQLQNCQEITPKDCLLQSPCVSKWPRGGLQSRRGPWFKARTRGLETRRAH